MKSEQSKQRVVYGMVVSDKMEKTVVVAVTRIVSHPFYGKVMRRISKFKAHDETNRVRIGDRVKIVHTRPLSKEKHWRVAEVVEQGEYAKSLS
ncbi:MAG: 30S ribosomal protein S17 [Nitrospirales bacterium]|nr:30S ribosomal protein S17 [Nitrospirales bacterium]